MKILVVEDDVNRISWLQKKFRSRGFDDYYAQSADAAIKFLTEHDFDLIMLDHDLGGGTYEPSDENSGYGVAKFMEESGIGAKFVIIHSLNPVGAELMMKAVPNAVRIPFFDLINKYPTWLNDILKQR